MRDSTYTYEGSNREGIDQSEWSVKGLIDTPDDVGGWPEYKVYDIPTDTDKDGIPDTWETAHGLNPEDPSDARKTTLSAPYLNLEVYLNDIVKHLY